MFRLPVAGLLVAVLSVLVPPGSARALATETTAGAPHAAADAARGNPRIVCLGDSLTEGYGLAPELAWPELVKTALRRDGWPQVEVINAGVSGSTSASAVGRLKWQLREKPDVVVLALGANDGLRGIAPEETRRNLSAAIDLAQTSGITVLLAGMKMPPNYGADYTAAFEATFASLAAEKKLALVPFLLDGVAANTDLNLPDGIHPNADGYAVVARTVLTHLKPLLAAATASAPVAAP